MDELLDAFNRFLDRSITLGGLDLGITTAALLLQLVLPVAAAYVTYRLALLILRRILLGGVREKVFRNARTALRVLALVSGMLIVYSLFGANLRRQAKAVWDVLSAPVIDAGTSSISLITLVLVIPVSYLAIWIARVSSRFMKARVLSRLTLSDATRFSLASITQYIILAFALLVGLSLLGINLSSLSVLLGLLGIGIGFGLQNVVASIVAGLVIIFERPIKEGDRVVVDGVEGDVSQIRLRSTVITTLTHETIIVPNHHLIDNAIHNNSHESRRIAVINEVQVSYATDLDQAAEVLEQVGARNPYADGDMPPMVRVFEFQDSGVLMQLWTWIEDASRKWFARSWANFEISRQFRANGIVIPFPQRDLHVKQLPELGGSPAQSTGSGPRADRS